MPVWIGLDWARFNVPLDTFLGHFGRRWGDCGISQDCSRSQSPQCMFSLLGMKTRKKMSVAFWGCSDVAQFLECYSDWFILTTEGRRSKPVTLAFFPLLSILSSSDTYWGSCHTRADSYGEGAVMLSLGLEGCGTQAGRRRSLTKVLLRHFVCCAAVMQLYLVG